MYSVFCSLNLCYYAGKAELTSACSQTLGGLCGIYFDDPTDETTTKTIPWQTVSTSTEHVLEGVYKHRTSKHAVANVLTQGFNPYDALNQDAVFDGIMEKFSNHTAAHHAIKPYSMSARKWLSVAANEVHDAAVPTPALIVARGTTTAASATDMATLEQFLLLLLVVFLDLSTVLLATLLFLTPLEKVSC
jgi:hypothetical protein